MMLPTVKYDGQPHGENGYSITMGSLVDGHAATVTISGSKTDAGEYEELLVPSGTKIVDAKGKDVTSYYDISYEDGTLTINKRSVTLTSETASKVYDGTPLAKPEVTSLLAMASLKARSLTSRPPARSLTSVRSPTPSLSPRVKSSKTATTPSPRLRARWKSPPSPTRLPLPWQHPSPATPRP